MKRRKLLALLLAVATILGSALCSPNTALAASINTKYPRTKITGYILSTSNKSVVAYSYIGGGSVGHIYASDDCTIQEVYTNGWVKVTVPWSGYTYGRVVYTQLSNFLNTSYTPQMRRVTVKTAAYNRSNLSKSLGHVYVGDNCYVVGESGNYYQVLCPWSGGGYRICWVNKSAFGHVHSYRTEYEAAHPHRVYKKCSCGDWYYTGATQKVSSCGPCNPHVHSYRTEYEAAHPHRVYKKCSCGEWYYTGATQNVSSCTTCNPAATYTGYVNTASQPLILRQSASTSSAALASMPRGSALTVLDNKAIYNGFYHVRYGSTTGYASLSYISFTKPQSVGLAWPASAKYVTCMYYYKNGSKHSTRYGYQNAMDIAGGGNIYAAAAGTVETATYQSGGFGNYIVILHNDGTRTLYGHLSSRSVSAGQYVSQGQKIGVMGSTGNSSGTHLHFEWSGGDPWRNYFKSDSSLIYEANVRTNNANYNSDKAIVRFLDSNYRYSGGYYYRK